MTCIKNLEDSFTFVSPGLHVIKMKSLSHLLLRKKTPSNSGLPPGV